MAMMIINPMDGLERQIHSKQMMDMALGNIVPSNLVHIEGMYKHGSLKKLVRFGVHKSIPFFIAATNEGYFIGGIGLTNENYNVVHKIKNDPGLIITFDLDTCPVELYDRLNNISNIIKWVGTSNNHYNFVPSLDMIDTYFPDNCDMGLYAKLIYDKQQRTNNPTYAELHKSEYTPDESETEKMLYRFIDNIDKVKNMEVSNE